VVGGERFVGFELEPRGAEEYAKGRTERPAGGAISEAEVLSAGARLPVGRRSPRIRPSGVVSSRPVQAEGARIGRGTSGVGERFDHAGVPLHDDGWAIRALPPGHRDLGCHELWERSLARSLRRREAAAARRCVVYKGKGAVVSAALLTATLVAPAGQAARAQGTTAGGAATALFLRTGSRGPSVAAAQRALGISADGVFGPQTRHAVLAFQAARGLAVDGVIGPITASALGLGGTPAGGPAPDRATTIAVQRVLGVAADGVYGPVTRAAVRRFQQARGLAVDGVVGPQTLAALGLSGAGAPPAAAPGAGAAVAAARSKLGAPYVRAGTGPNGFDCSGLTQWAMAQAGISLPRTSYAQFGVGTPVQRNAIQSGDLVFFDANGPGASHVGIATGASTAISATTHGVREHAISDAYWGSHYVGARRVG
jgi:cell wall-associated NlpC family hydrolase